MAGADIAVTWLNEKGRPHVEPLAVALGATITAPLDVSVPGELEALFETIKSNWRWLDILVHSIAFAPKNDLRGGCSAVPLTVSRRRWIFPVTPSFEWPGLRPP
jgi:enoyl-[acyl-carrier protein] reductase I